MEEKLEALANIGDIAVTRSDVDPKNGGYTWTITFLRDDSSPGGQYGDDCEQRDSFNNLCNAPGDVPALQFNDSLLIGACMKDSDYNQCPFITILTASNDPLQSLQDLKNINVYLLMIKITTPLWYIKVLL